VNDIYIFLIVTLLPDTKFPGFEAVRSDPEFLKKFLRLKDGNVEAALKAIKKYYAHVQRSHNYINGTKPQDLTDVFNCGFVRQLLSHPHGPKTTLLRVRYLKPKEIEIRKFQIAMLYTIEKYGLDPETQENGTALIFDLTGLRFEHIFCATPRELYITISALLVCMYIFESIKKILDSLCFQCFNVSDRMDYL